MNKQYYIMYLNLIIANPRIVQSFEPFEDFLVSLFQRENHLGKITFDSDVRLYNSFM